MQLLLGGTGWLKQTKVKLYDYLENFFSNEYDIKSLKLDISPLYIISFIYKTISLKTVSSLKKSQALKMNRAQSKTKQESDNWSEILGALKVILVLKWVWYTSIAVHNQTLCLLGK